MNSNLTELTIPAYLERTKKHFIIGHLKITYNKDQIDENYPVYTDNDESYITITPENVNELYKKEAKSVNFYNKYAKIGGKPIGSLVTKLEFDFKERYHFRLNDIKNNDKNVDDRCYQVLDYFFNINDKVNSSNYVNFINKAEEFVINNHEIIDKVFVRLDVYDLNLMGGTAGIIFGNNHIPLLITERATEYIMSDKVIIKSGTLEKSMSGISKINFSLAPLSIIPGWLLVHSDCVFDPTSLVLSYSAISSDKALSPDGITVITFKFVPIESNTFYKNVSMFEKQNKFFKWATKAATKVDSPINVLNTIPNIEMKLDSLEINNNRIRNSERNSNYFLTDIMNGLGLTNCGVIIANKEMSPDETKILVKFSDSDYNDKYKITHCIFKALA